MVDTDVVVKVSVLVLVVPGNVTVTDAVGDGP